MADAGSPNRFSRVGGILKRVASNLGTKQTGKGQETPIVRKKKKKKDEGSRVFLARKMRLKRLLLRIQKKATEQEKRAANARGRGKVSQRADIRN